jgi:hypothetical protein
VKLSLKAKIYFFSQFKTTFFFKRERERERERKAEKIEENTNTNRPYIPF